MGLSISGGLRLEHAPPREKRLLTNFLVQTALLVVMSGVGLQHWVSRCAGVEGFWLPWRGVFRLFLSECHRLIQYGGFIAGRMGVLPNPCFSPPTTLPRWICPRGLSCQPSPAPRLFPRVPLHSSRVRWAPGSACLSEPRACNPAKCRWPGSSQIVPPCFTTSPQIKGYGPHSLWRPQSVVPTCWRVTAISKLLSSAYTSSCNELGKGCGSLSWLQ